MSSERLLALGLAVVALLALSLSAPESWPLLIVAGIVVISLVLVGTNNGSIVAASLTLIGLAMLYVFVDEGPALGPLVACVLALVIADVSSAVRSRDDRGPAVMLSADLATSVVTTAGIAAGVIVVVMVVSLLPNHRLLTLAAVVALVALTAAVHRRRTAMPHAPLPPPPAGGPIPPTP